MIKPVIFPLEEVKAILDGRKLTFRRVVKAGPHSVVGPTIIRWTPGDKDRLAALLDNKGYTFPPYKPGDVLYVKEPTADFGNLIAYRADYPTVIRGDWKANGARWMPEVCMPQKAARIFLRVTAVLLQELQDIDRDGVLWEGYAALSNFITTWDHTGPRLRYGTHRWTANPWVWVFRFERISREEAGAV